MPGSPLLGTETETAVFVMGEPLRQRDRTDWQSWAWLKYSRGLIVCRVSSRGARSGERLLEGRMLSLGVPL